MSHEHLKSGSYYHYEPNYINDLNAIHAAVESKPRGFQDLFADQMSKIAARKGVQQHVLEAQDWCEAFLKVLGLWEEE
jgi:hypothetical protein